MNFIVATIIRSTLFNIFFVSWTFIVSLAVIGPGLLGPRKWTQFFAKFWSKGILFLLRNIVGLQCEIRGLQHIPSGSVIIAAKHQSAWETFIFHSLLKDPVFVVKKELFIIPLVGWLMYRSGCIGVRRSSSIHALRSMLQGAEKAVMHGSQIIIFPEGTRTNPGVISIYHPGVSMLYCMLALPVIPVALNSGLFWGRRSFIKWPGLIVIEFLPPVPSYLDRHTFTKELQSQIESSMYYLLLKQNKSTKSQS